LAVGAGALLHREAHESLRADEMVVKLLWLTLKNMVFGFENQRRASDLLCDTIAQVELEDFGEGCVRCRLAHDKPAVLASPFGGGRSVHALFEHAVKLGSFFLIERRNESFSLIWRHGRDLGCSEVVDAVISHECSDALLKAAARGASTPPMLTPIKTILSGSTPGRLSAKSTIGVTTGSQSVRNGMRSR
jgi:hypothetical protein